MKGITWIITAEVTCEDCGQKRLKDGVFECAYKFVPSDSELDDIRTELLEQIEILEKWKVYGLDTWDSDGEFTCGECVAKSITVADAAETQRPPRAIAYLETLSVVGGSKWQIYTHMGSDTRILHTSDKYFDSRAAATDAGAEFAKANGIAAIEIHFNDED